MSFYLGPLYYRTDSAIATAQSFTVMTLTFVSTWYILNNDAISLRDNNTRKLAERIYWISGTFPVLSEPKVAESKYSGCILLTITT